jgi:hypothetical protein
MREGAIGMNDAAGIAVEVRNSDCCHSLICSQSCQNWMLDDEFISVATKEMR